MDKIKNTKEKIIFISWSLFNRCTETLGKDLKAKVIWVPRLFEKIYLLPSRYIYQLVKTLKILLSEKAKIVVVQNPVIFATIPVFIYSRIYKIKYVIDCHSGPFLCKHWQMLFPLQRFLFKFASVVLLHNKALEKYVYSWEINYLVLEFKIPEFSSGEKRVLSNKFNVVVISTFASDEPVEEIIKAASMVKNAHFYLTGHLKYTKKFNRVPDNVTFVGFLLGDRYTALLRGADVIMDLTTRESTLLIGCYEAMSLEKPIITSDSKVLREYLYKGAIFVDNTAEGIANGVEKARLEKSRLIREVIQLKEERKQCRQEAFDRLNVILNRKKI